MNPVELPDLVVQQGFSWVSPETGSQEAFAPAPALYGSASFVACAAFGRYLPFRCPGPYVNGQVEVPAGGQQKSPPSRVGLALRGAAS